MLWRERACRAFAMHADFAFLAANRVGFEFGDVMRDVIHQIQLQIAWRTLQNLLERLTNPMRNDLPIRKRIIRRARHRGKIAFAFRRTQRRAAKLFIGQFDAVFRGSTQHVSQRVVADLIPQAARAGMHRHRDMIDFQA